MVLLRYAQVTENQSIATVNNERFGCLKMLQAVKFTIVIIWPSRNIPFAPSNYNLRIVWMSRSITGSPAGIFAVSYRSSTNLSSNLSGLSVVSAHFFLLRPQDRLIRVKIFALFNAEGSCFDNSLRKKIKANHWHCKSYNIPKLW